MHQRHAEMLTQATPGLDDLQATGVTLRRLERFWIRAADLVQRPGSNLTSGLSTSQPSSPPPRAAGMSAR